MGSEITETIPLPENEAKVLGARVSTALAAGVNPFDPRQNPNHAPFSTLPKDAGIKRWADVPSIGALPSTARIDWIADDLIPSGAITLLTGESGHYKSWLAMRLAGSAASGGQYLGRRCKKIPVVYLDKENPVAIVRERAELLGLFDLDDLTYLRYWGGWLEEQPPGLGDFRFLEFARAAKPLMIFDSLIRFHEGEENSATEMARVMKHLRDIANAGATVVVLHHRSKSETSMYRGSSDIKAGVDVAYQITFDQGTGLVTVKCFKNRYAKEVSMTLRPDFDQSGNFIVTQAPEIVAKREQIEQLRELIEREPGLSQNAIVTRSGVPQHRAITLLRGEDGKLWEMRRGDKNARSYFPLNRQGIEIEI
jgi:hypothetical protein